MVQNSLPINDNPQLVKCFEWINSNNENFVAVMNFQLYFYAEICLNKTQVILLQQPNTAIELKDPNYTKSTNGSGGENNPRSW